MHLILISTWRDGLYQLAGGVLQPAGLNSPVQCLAHADRDEEGNGALAIADSHSLYRRGTSGAGGAAGAPGAWSLLAASHHALACCVALGGGIYVGTDDAQVLRLVQEPAGSGGAVLEPLPGFERVPGRERWYAGSAVIDGRVVGPPLGVRSMTATCDGRVLLANVHVGGIARSTDGGATWRPTIDIDTDVHQVCAHPAHPELVAAAAGAGLCLSRDGGMTWSIEHAGLHARYCSAVAFAGDDVLVAASTDHFATEGALYRRALDRVGFTPLTGTGGLPRWLDGIADTANVAACGATVALADHGGHLYVSADGGRSWQLAAEGLSAPSAVLVVERAGCSIPGAAL